MFKILYLLFPFIVYFFWVLLSNSKFTNKKTFWVSVIAIFMFLTSLVIVRITETTSRNLDYIPPKVIDGKLNDGYFRKNDE